MNLYERVHFRLGSDPDKLFPYALMLEHLRKFARHSLIVASLLLPLLTGNQWDLNEVSGDPKMNIANGIMTSKPQSKLDKRLRDIIIDMARLDYI